MGQRKFLAHYGRKLTAILAVCMLLLTAGTLAMAQDNGSHRLTSGVKATGTLNAQNYLQVYAFEATEGDKVSVTVTSDTTGLTLGAVLTDANGKVIQQSDDLAATTVNLKDVTIAVTGWYYVTVVRGGESQEGNFSIQMDGATTATPSTSAPSTVTLTNGMEVKLAWASTDDLNLEVRDPVGGSIQLNNPAGNNGAKLSANVNANCQNTTNAAEEIISWPAGAAAGGSYEVIVYYNQACTQPANPVEFTLTITVDGKAQTPIKGTLKPTQQFVNSFLLTAADQVTVRVGGDPLEAALNLAPYRNDLLTAQPIEASATGVLNASNPVDAYSFEASAGQVVTVGLDANTGSLDPLLILVGPNGIPVASNDDANNDTRNSRIFNQILGVAGRYVILATRFGLAIGGTEGDYTVTLSGTTTDTTVTNTTVATTPAPAIQDLDGDSLPDGSVEVRLSWNTNADMRLLIRDPQGRVIFADNPQPIDSGILYQQGNFNCTATTTTPQTYAYWPTTRLPAGTYEVQTWVFNLCNDQVQPVFTLSVKVRGKQVLNVTDRPDVTDNRLHYVTSFTVDDAGNATAGTGGIFTTQFANDIGGASDQLGTAPALTYNRPVTGTINNDTPFVVYTFQGNAGDTVRLSLRSTSGTLDTYMFLLDAAGSTLAKNDDVRVNGVQNTNSQIEQTLPTTGVYIVIATRYGARYGGTVGNYELALTLVSSAQG